MAMNNLNDREISFEIVEPIGVIAEHSTGWKKEINLVSWNGNPPKYDIRDWDPYHEHMSRGVTLHEKEMKRIMELVCRRNGVSMNPQTNNSSNSSDSSALASAPALAPETTPFDAPQDAQLPETDSVPFA